MAAPRLSDKTVEQMLEMLRKGKSWDFVTKRYQIKNESAARRIVREYQRRKERG